MPEAAITLRHALHTYHHLEHAFERGVERQKRIAHLIAKAITGGPLSITIAATVNVEDLGEVPDEELADLEAEIYAILATTGIHIVEEAKALVPVDTGLLRNSISFTADNEALSVTITADTNYAKYVEYGTARTEAQPFLTDSAVAAEADMDEQINEAIANHMDGNVEGDSSSDTVDLEIEGDVEAFAE